MRVLGNVAGNRCEDLCCVVSISSLGSLLHFFVLFYIRVFIVAVIRTLPFDAVGILQTLFLERISKYLECPLSLVLEHHVWRVVLVLVSTLRLVSQASLKEILLCLDVQCLLRKSWLRFWG